jgi:hypothetical protein
MDDVLDAGNSHNSVVTQFETYEEYLDSQITPKDLTYLEDEDLARALVELGYAGSGESLSREDFYKLKEQIEVSRQQKLRAQPQALASANKDLSNFPFLQALAAREEMVRNGKLTVRLRNSWLFKSNVRLQTIIFIRDRNRKGKEISGYIDYAHRLKTENFELYFERKKTLLPRPTDLSFYNWDTQVAVSNSTPNFQVIAENEAGLLFKNKRDRKIINVDPKACRFWCLFSFLTQHNRRSLVTVRIAWRSRRTSMCKSFCMITLPVARPRAESFSGFCPTTDCIV